MNLEKLRSGAATFGVKLSKKQLAIFSSYDELLREANARINLIGPADTDTVLVRHLLDSLSCLVVARIKPGAKVVDIGSGAGLPGIPLAIAYPGTDFVLLDSTDKRTRFLSDAVRRLGLANVAIVGERAEKAGREEQWRDQFDLAVARAVAPLPTLIEYALPFIRPGGTFVAMRGPKAPPEVEDAKSATAALNGEFLEAKSVSVPGLDAGRILVVFKKTGLTPDRYPRRTGVPAKRPL